MVVVTVVVLAPGVAPRLQVTNGFNGALSGRVSTAHDRATTTRTPITALRVCADTSPEQTKNAQVAASVNTVRCRRDGTRGRNPITLQQSASGECP
jgi:hypothetical protein